jgi:high affinity sulfate transporter 1
MAIDHSRLTDRLARIAPGLPDLVHYRFSRNFQPDLVAGLSVAAVALPISIAYAQLAGFDPVVGLYSSILPLVAYAVFGTSRQLVVYPDAATCAMIASAVTPLAAGNADLYLSLSIALTFLTGFFCIAASFFRLGALADFLSRPILSGFLNGIAISIFLGQVGKLLGFSVDAGGIVPRLFEILSKLPSTHGPTLVVGLGSFAVLAMSRQFMPRLPAGLVAMIIAGAATWLFKLDAQGVAVVGHVPAGLPHPHWPGVPPEYLASLLANAAALALVLFTSGALTARSFATKGGYQISINRELAAFGAANIASALSQGFAVTGAASGTATAIAAGGRTQMTGLVAAASLALVMIFLTAPLQYIPTAALGAVLVFAAFSLFDGRSLREFWALDRREAALSVVTTLGVVGFGAIHGILIAVGLALARFIKRTARPRDEILGVVDGMPGFHSIERHPAARTFPGLVLYRFNGPVTFFNADYFMKRALEAAETAGSELRRFIIDAIPISEIDINGLYAFRDLNEALRERGVVLMIAGRRTEFLDWLREINLYRTQLDQCIFTTLNEAISSCRGLAQSSQVTE